MFAFGLTLKQQTHRAALSRQLNVCVLMRIANSLSVCCVICFYSISSTFLLGICIFQEKGRKDLEGKLKVILLTE